MSVTKNFCRSNRQTCRWSAVWAVHADSSGMEVCFRSSYFLYYKFLMAYITNDSISRSQALTKLRHDMHNTDVWIVLDRDTVYGRNVLPCNATKKISC